VEVPEGDGDGRGVGEVSELREGEDAPVEHRASVPGGQAGGRRRDEETAAVPDGAHAGADLLELALPATSVAEDGGAPERHEGEQGAARGVHALVEAPQADEPEEHGGEPL